MTADDRQSPNAPPLASSHGSAASDLVYRFTWQRLRENFIQFTLFMCALLSVLTTLAIIFVLVSEAVFGIPPERAFFQEISLSQFFLETRWAPQYSPAFFGIWPLVCGTFLIAAIAGLIGLPTGLLSAIYLSEYASPRVRSIAKPTLELLAGVPTVVYGYFGLRIVTPYFIRPMLRPADVFGIDWLWNIPVDGFNALSGGIVVGLMIIPTVCSLSEDVLRAVPRTLREAGYALGSTKFDVCVRVVVPSALSGIIAAFLLAISRAVGETMAVTIAAGQKPTLTLNPLSQIETMTAYVVNVMSGDTPVGTIEYKSLYAVALVLFLTTLVMNLISQMVLARYREVYQ
jgi:phosphate transport system permease protein